jgi:serine/threonine protein kinase
MQGTPGYCAPEVLAGTWRSNPTACDAFAIGAMLIELLSGSIPELHYRDPETGSVRTRVRAKGDDDGCLPSVSQDPRTHTSGCMCRFLRRLLLG